MRRILLSVLLASLVLPASAQAIIQVDKGIAGARLGNTKAQVRAALGKPRKVTHGANDFGAFTQYRYAGGITVSFQSGRKVTDVRTTGLGDRTARGVGVGSTEHAVRTKVPGIHCETIVGTRDCHTHQLTAGQRVTDFLLENGRVKFVSVGFVLD